MFKINRQKGNSKKRKRSLQFIDETNKMWHDLKQLTWYIIIFCKNNSIPNSDH